MKKWLLHIFLVSVLGMLTASCSQDVDELAPDTTGSGTVKIQFSLAMGESQSGSRAAWGTETGTNTSTGGDRVIGDTYENMIDLSKLQVFLFQGTTYLGEVGGLTLTPNSSYTTYTFTGEVTVTGATVSTNASGQKSLSDATIMVTANYDGYVNGNVAVTYNYLFDYIAEAYNPNATSKRYIPMWGMLKPRNGIPLNPEGTDDDKFINIGDIYMLRSMAKIEVELGSGVVNDYVIMGATLNKYNQKGNLLPAKFEAKSDDGTTTYSYFNASSTSDFETEGCINAYSSTVAPTNGLAFNVVNEGKSCVIYVPEYSANTKDLEINLLVATKDAPTTSISGELKNEGTFTLDRTSLVRNHWYKCTVNKIDYNTGFDLTLAVAPWVPNEDVLDYTKNTVGYSVGTKPWNDDTQFDEKDPTIVLLETGVNVAPASYKFTLQTPKNAEWRAVLEGEQIRFHTGEGFSGEILGDDDTSKTIHGFTSSDNSGVIITLGVKAEDSNMSGQFSARLRFYVNLNNKWYEIDLVDGNESTTDGDGLNHWTIKHLKSSLG